MPTLKVHIADGFRKMKNLPQDAVWENIIVYDKKRREVRIRKIFGNGIPRIKNVETGSIYINTACVTKDDIFYIKTKRGWKQIEMKKFKISAKPTVVR